MINPVDYYGFLKRQHQDPEDQVLMARIALNVMFDPAAYPVDLSEVTSLRAVNRMVAEGFLAYCAVNPKEFGSWGTRSPLYEPLAELCVKHQRPMAARGERGNPGHLVLIDKG